MRPIKFRAWDKKRKCWYGSHNPEMLTFYGFSIFGECTLLSPPTVADLVDIEITQFTDLLDKNGKEIYEGDIFTDKYNQNKVVVWLLDEARFGYKSIKDNLNCIYQFDDWIDTMPKWEYEIIGNIYENPNLIKEATNE